MDPAFIVELAGLGLAAFDPIGVAIVILLLAQPRGASRAWAFLLGSIASLLLLGMLVATGLGRPIVRFREQFPWLDTAFEVTVGVVLVGVGVYLLRRARSESGGLQPEAVTKRLSAPLPLLFVLGFVLVTVQNILDVVFLVAMVETGARLLSALATLVAVGVYTLAAVVVQVALVVAYQLLPDARRQAALDGFNAVLEKRGEQVAGWLALVLGSLLLLLNVGALVRLLT